MITAIDQEPIHGRQGGVWDYISPSRLGLFLKCPLAFRLRYVNGIRSPTSPPQFVGKVVHAGLEAHYRHRMLGLALDRDCLTNRVVRCWEQAVSDENMAFASVSQETALKSQAIGLIRAYLLQLPADEPRPLAVEATMEVPLIDPSTGENLGIPLLGVVDLILGAPDGPTICDFKTSSKAAPPHEITHELQLTSYAWLFRQTTGMAESSLEIRSLIKTKKPKVKIHSYSARSNRHFRRLFSIVHEYLDALDSGRFNYRPGWGCSMCDFRDSRCRTWAG
ncbi:MAG: PD-(D/E)XK nuclease family protein [Planctomycetes bacterium]|nr:PD-(D/E)XK nuclease family protein [Planctomycetota bacterium]